MLVATITQRKPDTPSVIPWVKPFVPIPPKQTYSLTNGAGTFMAVAMRRDHIIKTLLSEVNYKIGDTVVPADKTIAQQKATVIDIVKNYCEFNSDYKWPKSDNPLIVTCQKEDGHIYTCTTNYLEKAS